LALDAGPHGNVAVQHSQWKSHVVPRT
jgi:hypothetical protein